MIYLKQSTAATLKLGPFVDSGDGVTPEDALTITQAEVRLSKNGGDFAQKSETSSAVHDENGYYNVAIDATDTATAGRLKVAVSESGALPVWLDCVVLPAVVFDTLISNSSSQPTAVPGATAGILDQLLFLLMVARNKLEQTDSTTTLYDDAGTTAVAVSAVTNTGTLFTRGEWSDAP